MNIGDLFLRILADDVGFQADLVKKTGKAGDAAAKTLGQRLKAGLTPERIGMAMGAALGGIAAAGVRMGDKVDDAMDRIRVGTGATGDALKGLEDDFKAVSARVPDDLEAVGQAIADLHTRTGQTGKGLQDLATSILDFSRITKTDINENVRNATRVFGDWSIATEDQAATLDKVFRASQATGIGVTALMEKVVDFGSPLRLLGFQFEESIALLAKWEKEGVNTETALTGLKFSVKTLAREGVPASEMAKTLQERIAAIGKSADPVGDSISLFGLRAGPDLAAAILEGRFATEDLLEVIENGSDTIAQATKDTEGLGEAFKKFGNWVTVNFGGMFTAFAGLGNLVYIFPVVGGAFGKMAGKIIGDSSRLRSALETVALKGMYVADALKGAWKKVAASSVVTKAIAFAGGKAATVYLGALIAGDAIGGALKGVWVRFAATSVGQAIVAGTASGTAFATATAAAILAAPAIVLAVTVKLVYDYIGEQSDNVALINQITKDAGTASIEELKAMRERLAAALATQQGHFDPIEDFFGLSQQNNLQAKLDAVDSMIAASTGDMAASAATLNTKAGKSFEGVGAGAKSLSSTGSSAFVSLGNSAGRLRATMITNANAIKDAITKLTATLLGEAAALINGYYDPIIAQDELRVQKDTAATDQIAVNEARAALAKTKAGSVERKQAQLTLDQALLAQHQSQAALDTMRLNLLAAGALSAKEQKTWLAQLEAKYKTATGAAKADIGELIAKIHELQKVPTTIVHIIASIEPKISRNRLQPRAAGGPVTAGQPYLVNENTPNSEVWVPEVSGRVRGPSATPVSGGSTTTWAPQVTINNPVPHAAPEDFGRSMRRLEALGGRR